MIRHLERRWGDYCRTASDRLRAVWLAWRGANLGRRVRVGKGLVALRPWRLTLGDRTQLEHQVHIKAVAENTEIRLGREVFVGFGTEFDVSESLQVGDRVLIAPGCFITDHDHRHAADVPIVEQGCNSRPVRIEDDAWLGAKVVVLAGVVIGRGAVVAAGAVVTRDVAPMSIVAGVPARKIGERA